MKRSSLFVALAAAAVLSTPLVALAQNGSTTTPATPAKTTVKTSAKQSSMSSTKHTHMHQAKVDLNTASKDDLMKLKGMTDENAEKIIAARPYKSASELKSKKVIDAAEYSKIRGWVTVAKPVTAKK